MHSTVQNCQDTLNFSIFCLQRTRFFYFENTSGFPKVFSLDIGRVFTHFHFNPSN